MQIIGVEYEKDVDGNDVTDKDGNKIVIEEYFCNQENEIRLIGWYIPYHRFHLVESS